MPTDPITILLERTEAGFYASSRDDLGEIAHGEGLSPRRAVRRAARATLDVLGLDEAEFWVRKMTEGVDDDA